MVLTLLYLIPLNAWGKFNMFYIVMFTLQQIPNLYCFVICAVYGFSEYLPDSLQENKDSVAKKIYYLKPCFSIVALITLIVQLVPTIFASYLWMTAETDSEE